MSITEIYKEPGRLMSVLETYLSARFGYRKTGGIRSPFFISYSFPYSSKYEGNSYETPALIMMH